MELHGGDEGAGISVVDLVDLPVTDQDMEKKSTNPTNLDVLFKFGSTSVLTSTFTERDLPFTKTSTRDDQTTQN